MTKINVEPVALTRLAEFTKAYQEYAKQHGLDESFDDSRMVQVAASYATMMLNTAMKYKIGVAELLSFPSEQWRKQRGL